VLLDPDLLKLPVELTIVSGGVFGRSLGAAVDGLNGAACRSNFSDTHAHAWVAAPRRAFSAVDPTAVVMAALAHYCRIFGG
jgi:hypothetical protein